eukprot:10081573-Alexandrium_andersonii.AAC.1
MALLLSCLDGHPSAQLRGWNATLHRGAAALEQAVQHAVPHLVVREASSALAAARRPPLHAVIRRELE